MMKLSFHAPRWIVLGAAAAGVCVALAAARGGRQNAERLPLSTGKFLTPQGKQTAAGSFPANMVLSPDGKWIVVTDTGAREYLSVLAAAGGQLVSQIAVGDGPGRNRPALYVGLAFGPKGTDGALPLYASRGPEDRVALYKIGTDGKLTDSGRSLDDPSGLPVEAKAARPNFLAGVAVSADGRRCYAVHNESSAYTDYRGSVSVIDTATHRIQGKVTTPAFPYAVAVRTEGAGRGDTVYVADERDGLVSVLNVAQPDAPALARDIKVGDHPMALLLDKAQGRLFVANAGSDNVSILNTATNRITRTLPLRPANGTNLPGMTPTGLALSAVGQLVEALSRSPYWKDTAIFVLEDDAQDGQDHVDAHRSIAFVISSHLARGTVDHHFYNTDSVLHTMEVLLGLPPMNQYDATAPLFPGFGPTTVNTEPYAALLPAREIVSEVNQATAYRARDSRRLDFSRADGVPEGVLNDILWHNIKGVNTPMPAPHHLFRVTARPPRPDAD